MAIEIKEFYWIAGFLEGEGSFGKQGRNIAVTASQVQRWPLDRLKELVGGTIYQTKRERQGRDRHPINSWRVSGPSAVGLMMTMFSFMSPRRQEQIQKVLSDWRNRPTYNKFKTHCPKGHVYDKRRVIVRADGRRSNERGCSICSKEYFKNYREVSNAN